MFNALSRRRLLEQTALGAAMFCTPGVFADQLAPSAKMTEGPFYPDAMPLDTDNDLLLVNDAITPAVGEITHLSGRILERNGNPIRNAFVEIWQVDARGAYLHQDSDNRKQRDSNFQGYGRFLTDAKGQYYFRTIKPVPYPGRAPHIHIAVSRNGRRIFTSQILIQGHEQNQDDFLFRQLPDAKAKQTVLADFKPMADSAIGELAVDHDIILGRTIEENEDGTIKGGIGKRQFSNRR